jgi:hypothetical protein
LSNSKAICKFHAQVVLFDTGNKFFRECSRPSTSLLILAIQKESRTAQSQNNRSQLVKSAYQIALHEQSAQNQISQQIKEFLRKPAYGKAPREKPNNCIQMIMENFNSLGIFTKGTKINSLNKLCREFNTDILAGCKT